MQMEFLSNSLAGIFHFCFYLKHFPLVHIDREHEFAHSPKHGRSYHSFLIFDLFRFKKNFLIYYNGSV